MGHVSGKLRKHWTLEGKSLKAYTLWREVWTYSVGNGGHLSFLHTAEMWSDFHFLRSPPH